MCCLHSVSLYAAYTGLSPGALAVAIAVPIAVALAACLLGCCCIRRRNLRRRRAAAAAARLDAEDSNKDIKVAIRRAPSRDVDNDRDQFDPQV